jgi:hypothetical protein
MTKTATKTYLVGVIERAISYYRVEAEDARTAAENWQEGEFRDRDEALEAEGPCNVREKQPDGKFLMVPPSQWEAVPTAGDDSGRKPYSVLLLNSPAPWAYEYSPYQGRKGEISAYEIFDDDGNKVFVTNEDTPGELQEANACLGAAAPRLLAALIVCANLLADYDESDGPEGDAYREALAAIAEATGRAA